MMFLNLLPGAIVLGLVWAATSKAATITGWNTTNVAVGPSGISGARVVYDRDIAPGVAGAVTNGRIAYTFPAADSPGITVVQGPFTDSGNMTAGCVMASSGATCDSGFQSGKRFKQQLTGVGAMDLVFDVDATATSSAQDGYQVFQKLINQTGLAMTGFEITLGAGMGSGFAPSTGGDGLGFSSSFAFGPDNDAAFSQFPFGLFGDASTNPNFSLDGFFAAERSGFAIKVGEDVLTTTGLFGPYGGLFGPGMLTQAAVPAGAFWDDDNDPDTDDVLMAWLNGDGLWEQRREIVGAGVSSLATPATFLTFAELETAVGTALIQDVIEDLANVNINYSIDVAGYVGDSFTVRVLGDFASPQPSVVPLPATMPLLLGAFGLAGAAASLRRRAV